jgi:2-polyprenyl-3-methyl-5-hydroxy-6-metoxy-1,4-benzoquinol methylase
MMHKLENIQIEWETPVCVFCGCEEREHVVTSFDYEIDSDYSFTVVRCKSCGLCYTCPRPNIHQLIKHFYPDDYNCYRHKDDTGASRLGFMDRFFDERTNGPRRRRLNKYFNGRDVSLLDVGSGDGSLLKYLKRKTTWKLRGVEPNASVAESVRRCNLDIDCGLLEDIHYPDSSFDAITLTHVLEHVENPMQLLRETARILRPGGALLIEIPDIDALDRRLFGRFWWGYHLPRHTTHYTQRTLEMLSAAAGFTTVNARHYLRAGPMSWNFHIVLSKSGWPGFNFLSRIISVRNPLLMAAALPFEAVNLLLGRGNLLEILFTKKSADSVEG